MYEEWPNMSPTEGVDAGWHLFNEESSLEARAAADIKLCFLNELPNSSIGALVGVSDVVLRDKEPGAPVGCINIHRNSGGRCED